jgi:hypothetical protein
VSQNARAAAGSQQMPCAHLSLALALSIYYFPTLSKLKSQIDCSFPQSRINQTFYDLFAQVVVCLQTFDSVQHLPPSHSRLFQSWKDCAPRREANASLSFLCNCLPNNAISITAMNQCGNPLAF